MKNLRKNDSFPQEKAYKPLIFHTVSGDTHTVTWCMEPLRLRSPARDATRFRIDGRRLWTSCFRVMNAIFSDQVLLWHFIHFCYPSVLLSLSLWTLHFPLYGSTCIIIWNIGWGWSPSILWYCQLLLCVSTAVCASRELVGILIGFIHCLAYDLMVIRTQNFWFPGLFLYH